MTNFTPEQAIRWNAWQQANAATTERSELICRVIGVVLFLGALVAAALGALR